MNAPVDMRKQYVPTVNALMPGSEGDDLDVRCSLLLMRDCATSAKTTCSEEAYPILDQVERMASQFVFMPMPTDRMIQLRQVLRQVVAAAAGLDDWATGKGGDDRG